MKKKKEIRLSVEEVISEYSEMIFRLALARTGNPADAEDVMQEVFLRYMQKDKTFVDREHIKAWLIRVTINVSKNLVTSAWRRHTAPLEEAGATAVQMPETGEIYEAVKKLPEKYAEVLRLFHYEGYSIEEISEKLNLNESTVKSRLRRGRQKLRELLGVALIIALAGWIGFVVFRPPKETGENLRDYTGTVTGSGVHGFEEEGGSLFDPLVRQKDKILSGRQTSITPEELIGKYETAETTTMLRTRYSVGKKEVFSYEFSCDFTKEEVPCENLITVHTERSCQEESRITAGVSVSAGKKGSVVTVRPIESVLATKGDKEGEDSWGSAPVYYLALHYDQTTETAVRLDKPLVMPFTLKSSCDVPNLTGQIDEEGIFRLTWSPVKGAEEYRLYHYVAEQTEEGKTVAAGAQTGYHGGHLLYEGSVRGTSYESFSGGKKNESAMHSYKDGMEIVFGQNYNVEGDYYVTAVVDGRESVLSNAAATSGLKLPHRVQETADILYQRYASVEKLPASLSVENTDGTVEERKVLYRLHEGKGMLGDREIRYNYRIEGTKLNGYVVMEDESRDYPETVGSPSPAGERIPADEADKVPQVQGKHQNRSSAAAVPMPEAGYYVQADSAAGEWLALNLLAGREEFYIGDFPELTEPEALRDIFYETYYQNPYVFGVASFDCDYEEHKMQIQYLYSREEQEKVRREIRTAAENAVKEVMEGELKTETPEKTVEAIYQWLVKNCQYDREAWQDSADNGYEKGGAKYEYAHNAYGALVKGRGMCQSFADAFLLLGHMAGVETVAVSGYMNQSLPHIWNAVKLGGTWYYIDATNNGDTTGVPYYLYLAGEKCAGGLQYVQDGRALGHTGKKGYTFDDETREYYISQGLVPNTLSGYESILMQQGEEFCFPFVVRREGNLAGEAMADCAREILASQGVDMEQHSWQTVGKYFLVK